METIWFFRLRFRQAYDSAYDSDFRFSLCHKLSYDSDYDSDSVACENQPLRFTVLIDSPDWWSLPKKSYLGEAYGDCRADICTISLKYFTLADLKPTERKFLLTASNNYITMTALGYMEIMKTFCGSCKKKLTTV